MTYTVEQVAWDGANGQLEVGWATMRGRRHYGGEIIDVYADRELADAWVRMMNNPPVEITSSMGEPSPWEYA